MPESAVKVSNAYYQAIKKLADDLGMSVREVTDKILSNGLSNLRAVGRRVAEDSDLLSQLQNKIDKAGTNNIQDQVDKLKADQLKLQTRLAGLEDGLEGEEDEVIELTKDDLLNPKRAIKPGKQETDDEVEYYCKDCFKEGRKVALDPDENPEVCPECGRKINWEGEGGMGGVGWALAGLAALLLLGGARKSF